MVEAQSDDFRDRITRLEAQVQEQAQQLERLRYLVEQLEASQSRISLRARIKPR